MSAKRSNPSQRVKRASDAPLDVPLGQKTLTSLHIARRLHLKRKTAERKLRAGVFPGAFQEGRVWYLREIDYIVWLNAKSGREVAS